MSTSPVSGSALLFPKTLVGLSTTTNFTVSNTSTTRPGPPPTLGGGGFGGSFPAASAPFSPGTAQAIHAASPAGYSSPTPYSFVLPPAVVAADGGQSSITQVYTFTPTVRGTSTQPITFKPTTGYTIPSSTVTLTGQGVAPVISLDTSSSSLGNVRIGTAGAVSFKVINVGDGNQAGAGLGNLTGTVGAGSGGFSGSGGSFNLLDSGSQGFSYTITPATHGTITTNISIGATDGNANGTNSAQNLSAALSATGVGPTLGTSIAAGSTLAFSSPQAPPQTISVANATADANLGALTNLDILSASLSGPNASMFSLSGFNPGTILTKSQSANLQLSFTPGSGASGTATATLTLVTDEGAANGLAGKTVNFTLSGTAALVAAYWKGGHGGAWNSTSPGFNWTVADGSSTEVSALPSAGTDVFFSAANPITTNTTLGQDFSVKSLSFGANSASMTIGGSNTLSIANGITVASGGTASQTISSPVQLGASQTWTVGGSGALIVRSAIGGSAAMVKAGSGTLLVTGANTYGGGTAVSAGTFQIGDGGTTGSIIGNITNNAALVFDRSDNVTFPGVITGTGGLTKAGAGVLTLTSSSLFFGRTVVTGGALDIAQNFVLQGSTVVAPSTGSLVFDQGVLENAVYFGGLTGSGNIALHNNAASPAPVLLFVGGNFGNTTYAGALSGPGSVTKIGGGRLVLSGDNTYTGGTIVTRGLLEATNVDALANGTSLAVGANATAIFAGAAAPAASAPAAVPEPATGVLLAAASVIVAGAAMGRWRRRRNELARGGFLARTRVDLNGSRTAASRLPVCSEQASIAKPPLTYCILAAEPPRPHGRLD
jgi:fibronectin-binding autotransporter adhesin